MAAAVDVAVVGAGFSGIGAAVALSQAGIDDEGTRTCVLPTGRSS